MGALEDRIRAYYAALNRGEVDAVADCFSEQAIHYYTTLEPTVGAREIASLAVLAHEAYDAAYFIEHLIEDGESVCVEWTMTWRDPGSGRLRLARGAEIYAFEGDRILEVRSYSGSTPTNRSGNLLGFDHAGRGYMVSEEHA